MNKLKLWKLMNSITFMISSSFTVKRFVPLIITTNWKAFKHECLNILFDEIIYNAYVEPLDFNICI